MSKIKFNRKKLSELNGRVIVRNAAVLTLAATQVLTFSGCGKNQEEAPKGETKTFTFSYMDQAALDAIPYNIKGVKNTINESDVNLGKERELEKKYVFEIGKYYNFSLYPDKKQDLYLLGHNEACDGTIKDMWEFVKDLEKTSMSAAYLRLEFKSVFPKSYGQYYRYIGNSNIFDCSVDYQILKSEDNNYYVLKTYSLTLKKQPQKIKPTWPVGETFKHTVFAKINLLFAEYDGADILAEQCEGIGSDDDFIKEDSAHINDFLQPAESEKVLKLK